MENPFVNKVIIKEIEEKQDYLIGNLNVICLLLHNFYQKHLYEDASFHSYDIEEKVINKKNKRDIKEGLKALEEAFRWGQGNFSLESLNEAFIKDLAGKAEPKISPAYRTTSARIILGKHMPPQYGKIHLEMDNYIQNIKQILSGEGIRAKIEAAIYAHLHLVRIHPFVDGNGRTARTFQNIILKKARLPPPIIYAGERDDYFKHLDNAKISWQESKNQGDFNIGEGEREFYDYIAGKISASLDIILKKSRPRGFI